MSNPRFDSRMVGLRKLLVAASRDAADLQEQPGTFEQQLLLIDRLVHHFAQGMDLMDVLHDEVASQVLSQQRRETVPPVAADDLAAPVQVTALHTFTTEANRRLQVMEEITCAPMLPLVAATRTIPNFLEAFEEATRA